MKTLGEVSFWSGCITSPIGEEDNHSSYLDEKLIDQEHVELPTSIGEEIKSLGVSSSDEKIPDHYVDVLSRYFEVDDDSFFNTDDEKDDLLVDEAIDEVVYEVVKVDPLKEAFSPSTDYFNSLSPDSP